MIAFIPTTIYSGPQGGAFDKEIEQKQAEKRYLLIGFFVLLVVLSIIVFLVYINTKKKQEYYSYT